MVIGTKKYQISNIESIDWHSSIEYEFRFGCFFSDFVQIAIGIRISNLTSLFPVCHKKIRVVGSSIV
ncbi:hypothetical protein BH11BAC1_BH11BAC1_02760 [soil metagenome]